jgi:YfiH family protein
MRFEQRGAVRYLTFDLLREAGLGHAVFTRQGGISPAPWASLNLSVSAGDAEERVAGNLHRALSAAGREAGSVFDVWQVHGADVVRADGPRGSALQQADAILTDRPGVTLLMRYADCTPILLYDPVHRAAALVHAGWKGTVGRVAARAVEAMRAQYGSRPGDLLAAFGPSIAAHHYPVGPEVAARVRQAFGQDADALLPETVQFSGNGRPAPRSGPEEAVEGQVHFDLWAANRLVLEQAGVRKIENPCLCTACHLTDWFSHRAENGQTGRFGASLWLEE